MTAAPSFRITALRVRAVDVPIAPLRTASGAITSCPLVLLDLATDAGMTGRSYVFAYTCMCLEPLAALLRSLESLIVGQPAAPLAVAALLEARFRLVGTGGLVAMALGGIDMALWDAQAKVLGRPLVALLGATPRALPAYWSVGMCSATEARAAADAALAHGCRALKIKIGFPSFADDLAAIRAAREVGGAELAVMVDYNQSLSLPEAQRRMQALENENLAWIEEPLRMDDDAGHAILARELRTPLQLGENWSSPREMARSIAARASDLTMIDAMKIGGVTGWQAASALAQVHGLPVSSHLFPEFSAHLLAATPTAHWLEFLDLTGAVLREPARVVEGAVKPGESPGAGVEWNEVAVESFGVRTG